MKNLMATNDEVTMTLKELTDLIGVRHNDAMGKVEKLAKEEGFGWLRKTRSQYESGRGRVAYIDTYQLSKKQAIAVGARLNNTLLMRVINRLEELELEHSYRVPQTYAGALRLAADLEEANQKLLAQNKQMKPKAVFADSVAQSETSILIGQFAKAISTRAFTIGQNKLFKWLRDNGYLISSGTRRNQPMQKYVNKGYFEVIERTVNNPDGSTRITLTTKITGKGQVKLTSIIRNAVEL